MSSDEINNGIVRYEVIWTSPTKNNSTTQIANGTITSPTKNLFKRFNTNNGKRLVRRNLFDIIEPATKVKLEEIDNDENTTSDNEQPLRRKRGRPRRIPPPVESETKPKRKPGRPRKVVTEEPRPKRPRGRPKKIPTESYSLTSLGTDDEDNVKAETSIILPPETDILEPPRTPTKRKNDSLIKTDDSDSNIPIPSNHDFTSPLKQVILNNLKEYEQNVSPEKLVLNRDFVNVPVPPKDKFIPNKYVSSSKIGSFLDTFEGYFDQTRRTRKLNSQNSISQAEEVTRSEFSVISNLFNENVHSLQRKYLFQLQKKLFSQFWFELSQGYSILFYGVGSKIEFLEKFALKYLSQKAANSQYATFQTIKNEGAINKNIRKEKTIKGIPCLVINGYNPTCSYRDIYQEILNILPNEKELNRSETKFWGNHVLLHIQKLANTYKSMPPGIKLIIAIHNIDGPALRKEVFKTMLSSLATIKQIAIVASADHIYTPVLWNNDIAADFNFVFHDITNYKPSGVESSFRDVLKIGKSGSSAGPEAAKYVLQSLTENSKKMYKLLVETQLSNMDAHFANSKGFVTPNKKATSRIGVEFRTFSNMCAAEFIASNDSALRSMLREFVEHKLANVTKLPSGNEFIWVPFNYGETVKLTETVLKDIER